MRAAIYQSVFSLGATNSTLPINCPTGNCTFGQADTLGFCSTCSDVTADSSQTCKTGQAQGFDLPNGSINCTYQLPDNVIIPVNSTQIVDDFGAPVLRSDQFRKTTNMSIITLPRSESFYASGIAADPSADIVVQPGSKPAITTFQGATDPLLAFGRVVFNSSFIPIPVIGGNIKPKATECALYWCVQTLNSPVTNGILSQNTIQTWFNKSAADTADSYLSPPPSGNQKPRNYFVGPMSNLPLVRFLEDTFTVNISALELPGSGKTLEEVAELTVWSSDVAQALWNVEDLAGFMNNLADRMTDTLRNQFADPSNSPKGSVYVMQTYVHVKLALAHPASCPSPLIMRAPPCLHHL